MIQQALLTKVTRDFFTEEHAVQALQDEQEIIRTGVAVGKEEKGNLAGW